MNELEQYIQSKMLEYSNTYGIKSYKIARNEDENSYKIETYPAYSNNNDFSQEKYELIIDVMIKFDGVLLSFVEDYNQNNILECEEIMLSPKVESQLSSNFELA